MTVSPFRPMGTEARWRTVYKLLIDCNVGDVLTYERMCQSLDLNPRNSRDRTICSLAMRRAAQEYEREQLRTVDSVRGIGYRVVEPEEHLGLARRHQKKASRSVTRARNKLEYVNLDAVNDPEVRRALELAGQVLRRQQDMMRNMSIRQVRLEQVVDRLQHQTDERANVTSDQIARLNERLARLERASGE